LVSDYEKLMFRASETLLTVVRLAKVLGSAGIPYVVVKTLRPYLATPNDVDVVFLGAAKDIGKMTSALGRGQYIPRPETPGPLQRSFFDPRGKGRPAWDRTGGIYYVDVYIEMGVDHFIWANKRKIGQDCRIISLDSSDVCVLTPEADLAVVLFHSVFPENTYALEVFFTTCHLLKEFHDENVRRFVRFVKDNHFSLGVRANLTVTLALHQAAFGFRPPLIETTLSLLGGPRHAEEVHLKKSDFSTPHRFRASTFFRTFAEKAVEPTAFVSLGVQGFHMVNPRFAAGAIGSLWKRLTRGDYDQV
jgi:hypothetical protein